MTTDISNLLNGVVFVGEDGVVSFMNSAAETLLGVKSFMLMGNELASVAGMSELVDALRNDLDGLPAERESASRTAEVHDVARDLLYIKVQLTRVADFTGKAGGVLCVLEDVTEDYKTDQLKNQYLSIVAHELRTPLTGIKTFSTMMWKGVLGELNDKQQRVIESIREQSLRLEHQIDKLISLGHIESEEECYGQDLNEFAVHEFINTVAGPLELVAASRDIKIVVECSLDPALEIRGDQADLRRAIQAIVENAIKFAPDGGQVTVSAVAAASPGGVILSVRDDGPGIDPRYHRRIFEKFFQVEDPLTRHHGGAGLGLFYAGGVVAAHGGSLEVESEIGQGARFSFEVPMADTESKAVADNASGAAANATS